VEKCGQWARLSSKMTLQGRARIKQARGRLIAARILRSPLGKIAPLSEWSLKKGGATGDCGRLPEAL
jgi:hypothetical protein